MPHSINLKKIIAKTLMALVLGGFLISSTHAVEPINTTWRGNLAVEGYDTVAYFTENQPVKGKKEFQTEWRDANWRFASQEHLNLFQENPEKYAPQYGGYCAWAVSKNATASIDPAQFTIFNDKLYLNYNAKIQKQWTPVKEEKIALADGYWPELVDDPEE